MATTSKNKNKNKTTPDYTGQATEYYANSKKGEIDSTNTLYDSQKDSTNESYNKQVFDTSKSYENQYRENAVQKEINKRQVAESMANLGLTDSGLNRTQQTAIQLSYGNNKAAIDSNKNSTIDNLEFSRRQALDDIERSRTSALSTIEQNYAALIRDRADNLRSEDEVTYSQWVSTALQNGEMPSDEVISLSGMSKSVVTGLYNLYKTANTKSDYQNLVITSVQNGVMPSDEVISLAGMEKSEVKDMYSAYKKILNSSYSTKNTSGGNTKPTNIISSKNGMLSRNYTGTLESNGVSVENYTDSNGNQKTKYTDRVTGYTTTFDSNVNPYTNTVNPDVDNGTFTSGVGYQPNNITIDGTPIKLQWADTIEIKSLGRSQNVFKTTSNKGTQYWLWDDSTNKYVELTKKGDSWQVK